MSKTLVLAAFLGYISESEAKIRPIVETHFNQGPVVENAHERKVREHLVQRCSHEPTVGAGHTSPVVQVHDDVSCQNLCIFKDDQNSWCFASTSPMLTTGWNWRQYTGTNFWQLLFQPYMETQVEIDSTLKLERFM